MLSQRNPRLRRTDIMFNSFSSCVSDTPKEFTWAPEVSFSEIISQPGVFMQEFKGTISFKQLKGFTNTHCWRQLNKQVDMVNSNMEFVNFTSMFQSNLSDKPLTINSDSIKLHRVHCIFTFPHKVEGILPEGMIKTLQTHFFAPKVKASKKAHANFVSLVQGDSNNLLDINNLTELNIGGRIPPMFENMGALRQM